MDRLIPLQKGQMEKLPFPPGCKVYTYDDSQCPPCADSHGTVSGAFLRTGTEVTPPSIDIIYKVDLSVRGQRGNSKSELLLGKHLRFQNGTPVHVLKSRGTCTRTRNHEDGSQDGNSTNGAPPPLSLANDMKKEIVEGIVLGTCDIPNNDRGKYTNDAFWYSIQILGIEQDERLSEIIHEVRPGDVTHRTIPTLVQFHNALKVEEIMSSGLIHPDKTSQDHHDWTNKNTSCKNIVGGEDVINIVECETQTTRSSSKRDCEETIKYTQRRENSAGVPLPPPPMDRILTPPHPPPLKRSGEGNSEMGDDEPSSKRQCCRVFNEDGVSSPGIENEKKSFEFHTTNISPQSKSTTKNTQHDDISKVLPTTCMPAICQGEGVSRDLTAPQRENFKTHHDRKSREFPFQLRPPPKHFRFQAIIDIPSPENLAGGGMIGHKGCIHKELTKSSRCVIAVGGDFELTQVRIYGDTASDVEKGVRGVRNRLLVILKDKDSQNLDRIMDNSEVKYFRDDTMVSKFALGSGPHSKKDPLRYPSYLACNRTLRREHSDVVPRGNLRLMLPGINFFETRRALFTRPLRDLLNETDCEWISPEKDGDGTSFVKVYAHNPQAREDGVYCIFEHLKRELGGLPDAFILEHKS